MRRPYRKLTLDERRILATMLQAKATKTKIAEVLDRDRSTIHREIKRKLLAIGMSQHRRSQIGVT